MTGVAFEVSRSLEGVPRAMPKGRKRQKAKGRHKKRGAIPAKKMSPIIRKTRHKSLSATTAECSSSAEDSETTARHPGKNLASK